MYKKDKRIKRILEILHSHPEIHIHTLQDLTNYPTSSLRRDLVDLEDKGLIQRTFGKIRLLNQENLEYTWEFRESNNKFEKDKIAKLATSFIEDNDAIFIDSSTTTYRIMNYISDISELKVITNNLKVAEKAQYSVNVKGFVAGGFLKPLSQAVVGTNANNYIQQFHAKSAFISANTISAEGLYMASTTQTEIKKTMIKNAVIVFALIDHSKFTNKYDFVKLCDLSAIDYLITDRPITNTLILDSLKKNKVNIIYKRMATHCSSNDTFF